MPTSHRLSSATTQELGVNILNDLHRQRQTITNARDTLHGADDNIATARRVLATMSRRLMTNKLIMGGVCQHCNIGQLGAVQLHLLHDHTMCGEYLNVSALQESACFSWCDFSFLDWHLSLPLCISVCTHHPAAVLMQTLLSMLCRAQLV